jgi:hypothetical protein
MPGPDEALRRVLSPITTERIKSGLAELARLPSPLMELLETKPQLRCGRSAT